MSQVSNLDFSAQDQSVWGPGASVGLPLYALPQNLTTVQYDQTYDSNFLGVAVDASPCNARLWPPAIDSNLAYQVPGKAIQNMTASFFRCAPSRPQGRIHAAGLIGVLLNSRHPIRGLSTRLMPHTHEQSRQTPTNISSIKL